MNLNLYSTKDYENKLGLLTMENQTQSNPISQGVAVKDFREIAGVEEGVKKS